MNLDTESLKVLGSTLALLISTATIQFKLAEFINKKRDNFPNRRDGKVVVFSEIYDWVWGYLLGIFVNLIFLVVSYGIKEATEAENKLCTVGSLLFTLYLVNFVLWTLGFIIDGFRLKYPGEERAEESERRPDRFAKCLEQKY